MSVDPLYWQANKEKWRNNQVENNTAEGDTTTTKSEEISMTNLETPMTFELLYLDDIWICDSGASSNSMNNERGAKNIKSFGSQSLGHTGKAVGALKPWTLPDNLLAKMEAQE